MADEREAAGGVAARLAVVCAYLEEIRTDLREGPGEDEGPVEHLLVTVREGGDLTGPLAALHAILQVGGDPQGLDGYTDHAGTIRGVRPAGISDRPTEQVYLCPIRKCGRYWWPQSTAEVPRCAISGTALRRERL
ncbi:hypothetical protein [Streptomyces ureilyticus]|uniref:Zinc finger CGNR domain-containing protein n=1 Tax=Streptomyces ureilyticus TaxID=1775131 RepID=A0ABX0E5K3_9ACTN|nr:hypothetical protein [Streptomyces ureilyticus]NGO48155.1 hypothetical protein [Streptomyces ureilyticus]